MKLNNPARFWTGVGMGLVEVVGLGFFGLTLVNWDFLTSKGFLIGLVVSAIILYNFLAALLIQNGSKN